MAKQTSVTPVTNQEPLVLVQFSYWAKFIMPASVAADLVRYLSDSRVVRVESTDDMYVPVKHDWSIRPVDQHYISDLPRGEGSGDVRKGFLEWIKMKRDLVGKSYVPETYTDYLIAKEE